MSATRAYIARRPCGCAVAVASDSFPDSIAGHRARVADAVAGWIGDGLAVNREDISGMGYPLGHCEACRLEGVVEAFNE